MSLLRISIIKANAKSFFLFSLPYVFWVIDFEFYLTMQYGPLLTTLSPPWLSLSYFPTLLFFLATFFLVSLFLLLRLPTPTQLFLIFANDCRLLIYHLAYIFLSFSTLSFFFPSSQKISFLLLSPFLHVSSVESRVATFFRL